MVTVRLVAPGAMSPVSTVPSFRTTRCVTRSLFLNTTDCPPTAAGLGENDWLPFWPTMVIVATFDGGADDVGVAGFDDPPQPAAATASAITAPIRPLLIRVASVLRFDTDTESQKARALPLGIPAVSGRFFSRTGIG